MTLCCKPVTAKEGTPASSSPGSFGHFFKVNIMVSTASPAPSCMAIDQEIQDKGLTAPRVTPQHIQSVIASEHYFTAAQGYEKSAADNFCDDPYPLATPDALHLLTFCVLVLKNGFTVTGESACASPENFDPEIGMKIAFENAVNKIWMLEGYLLKEKLWFENQFPLQELTP